MDSSFDIFQIYSQYCEITTREVFGPNDELLRARTSREALSYLLKISESKINTSVSILEEVYKLMSRLDLMADFSEFSRFYDFVFFICREKGQRNITVSMAVAAWRLVLTGRFRLLDQWCKFVEENQKHNISEDTWRQVLAFSRCVHENLEGYDPEGAWPVLIDDFVEYMYRTKGSQSTPCLSCSCGDPESQQCEDMLSGLKIFPGSKRKTCGNSLMDVESKDETASFKRRVPFRNRSAGWGHIGGDDDDCVKHGTPFDCTKSHCAVEGCLSKGFAGLLSSHSCLQFDQDRRVSYT